MKSKSTRIEEYETKATRKLVTLRLHPYTVELVKALVEASGENKTRVIEAAIWMASENGFGPFFETEDEFRSFKSKWAVRLQQLHERLGPRFVNEMKSSISRPKRREK